MTPETAAAVMAEREACEKVAIDLARSLSDAYLPAYRIAAAIRARPAPVVEPARVLPREPTEAMLRATQDWSVKKYGDVVTTDAAIRCWTAMYDAALADLQRAEG